MMTYDVLITSLYLNSGDVRYAIFDFWFSKKIKESAKTKQKIVKTDNKTFI